MEVSIKEAVRILGMSSSTIRRRIRSGVLKGRKESIALGEGLSGRTDQWLVEIPDEGGNPVDERTNGNDPGNEQEEPMAEEESSPDEPEEEVVNCAVCKQPVLSTDYSIEASYGTVHEEPCSHQTRPAR